MKHKRNISSQPARFSFSDYSLPAVFLTLTLFLVPLFPDEKLNRLKLIVFGVGLILTVVTWALSKTTDEDWTFYRTPLDPAIAVYFIFAVFHYMFSANRAVASSEFQRMIFSVGAYFTAVQVCSGKNSTHLRKWVLWGWTGGLFLVSLYGIMQKNGGIGPVMVPQLERIFGTFGNPIFFAAFLIISIPIVSALWIDSTKMRMRILLMIPLISGFLALFYTKTRAAFLALPLAMILFYLLLEYSQNWNWTKKVWRARNKIAVFGVAFILSHWLLSWFSPYYHQKTLKFQGAIHASRITATSQTHTVIWKDVVKMWQAHPWFGTGYGTFHIEFPQYASDELKKIYPQSEKIINDAHNEYLQILAETGLIGFLIFFSVILLFYVQALKTFYVSGENRIVFAGLMSGVTALLVQNLFSVDMRFIVSSVYVFLTMGLIFSFSPRSIPVRWGTGRMSLGLKLSWSIFFLLVSGWIGFGRNPQGFYLAGIYRLGPTKTGALGWEKTPASGPGLLPALIRPYLSQKVLARTPDFFDQKLLNSAQTIKDFENLTRQFPQQWKYWEKLGYALAKEIQKTDPKGNKIKDWSIAEKAVEAYLKAYELNPSADGPPNNLGNIYYTFQKREEAITWWKKAIETNPDKIDARLNLGLAYYYQGKIKESATQFEEVLKREPKNKKAIVMLRRMVE